MLEAEAESLGLKRIKFMGAAAPQKYYDLASMVVLTSQTEGFPLVLNEAMARGCICIAFNCSAGVKCLFDYKE